MKNFIVFLFSLCMAAPVHADTPQPTALSPAALRVLWSGSWETDGALVNRADLRLELPWQGLSLRAQAIDKRNETSDTAFAGGLYHAPTTSRLLYGELSVWGLSARLKSPWARSLPFADAHPASGAGLATEPSSTKQPEAYLYLGLPRLGSISGFASLTLGSDRSPAISAGLTARFSGKASLRVEGFYTGKELSPRNTSAWFSESPPLPARDFRLYGASLVYTAKNLVAAGDIAYSDTLAYGRDLYGNLSVRLGNRPWRVSLAADAAGSRYVGADGAASGAGFRTGVRLDHYSKQSGDLRLDVNLRSPGIGDPFDRSSTLVSYSFPSRFGPLPLKPTRVSLSLSRNASKLAKIEDKANLELSARWGAFLASLSGTVSAQAVTDKPPIPFPIPLEGEEFAALQLALDASYRINPFRFGAAFGYTARADKEPLWDAAISASVQGKPGRLSVKLSAPALPSEWTCAISWRLEGKLGGKSGRSEE